jgi:hypothetical protein
VYAVVEIMGRRTRAGMVSDATLGGATLLRIEHPTRADYSGEEPLTEYYALEPSDLEQAMGDGEDGGRDGPHD